MGLFLLWRCPSLPQQVLLRAVTDYRSVWCLQELGEAETREDWVFFVDLK